ncbi:hypothetical protein [Bariatricus sp. HCP28S3_C2]|uniref:hypothetical protein n=1 Tax=unclassified Bariatricus TaxID=2677046 RepID=UPI00303326B5|nr:hypothetical protein [Lachnospiraceae bacterium]
MAQIKIFQSETYPTDIHKVRSEILDFSYGTKKEIIEEKYINDYASSKLWDPKSEFGRIHGKLMNYLEGNDIVAYHNTRLLNPLKIKNNGLIFSDERYIDSLREDMQHQDIPEELVDDIISKVIKERDRWENNGVNRRKNEICFIYDWDYYEDYDKFLATYGGEFLEFALESIKHNGNLEKYKKIIKMGKPYVIEFAIPFSKMNRFQKQDVARYMLEEWIHLDIRRDRTAHQYDGRIEFEIPAQKIICIHEVEDNFPDIDRWLFD